MSDWGSIRKHVSNCWPSKKTRPRNKRSLKAKFHRRFRKLVTDPRSEIPHRQAARAGSRPAFAAEPEFYREFLRAIHSTLDNTPNDAGNLLRIALRLSPYVEAKCLVVDAWARLSFWHRAHGRQPQAERTLEVAFELATSCPACIARLNRPLALLRRDQGLFDEALRISDEAIDFYQGGYDLAHDLEPDSFAWSLSVKAGIYHYAERPKEATHYVGWALSVVAPARSPELYQNLLVNYPQSLADSDNVSVDSGRSSRQSPCDLPNSL